jgi:hypothetical protein
MIAPASSFILQPSAFSGAAPPRPRRRRWSPPASNTAPLTNHQKMLAGSTFRSAFYRLRASGALAAETDEETWRHEQQQIACGRALLRSATQDDFCFLMGRACWLNGDDKQADYWYQRAALEPKRFWIFKIREMAAKRGVDESYANGICHQAYGVDLRDANLDQMRHVWLLVQKMPKPVAAVSDRRVAAAVPAATSTNESGETPDPTSANVPF